MLSRIFLPNYQKLVYLKVN